MLQLYSKTKYDKYMDKDVIPLCNAINALPGVKTIGSCCGHGEHEFRIWFMVEKRQDGLFFLTRCADRRYWKYGHLWKIELSVGDLFEKKQLPIYYELHSGSIFGKRAYEQAESLVENMNYHLNHVNFMNGFELNVKDFTHDDLGIIVVK